MNIRILLLFITLLVNSSFSLAQEKAQKIDELVKKYNEYRLFNGSVLVAENGKIIYNEGIGMANFEWNIPNTSDTKFRLGSITKQFTAAIILKLVEQGKLQLDNKVTDILPDYPQKTGNIITIHHLLTHTSGIPNYTNFPKFMTDSLRNFYTTDGLINFFKDKDLDFEPGSQFSYSNSGYLLLGALIEKVTGKSYENVLDELIIKPLNMNNTGYDHFEKVITKRATGYEKIPTGYSNSRYLDMSFPFSAGAMYSTVEDLYLWDQALYSDNFLSTESKEKIFTGYIPAFGKAKYGYGWSTGYLPLKDDSILVIQHGGGINGFNTMIKRIVQDKHLVVLLNNTPAANLDMMADGIISILYNVPYDMPKPSAVDVISKTLLESGVDKAIEEYMELKKNHEKEYTFFGREMNDLGYILLRENKIDDALAIFKLNIEENPKSSNAYDSYAEALLVNGDTTKSMEHYKKSLELNPGSLSGIAALKKLNVPVNNPAENPVFIDTLILKSYTGKYEISPNFIITITTDNQKIYGQATGQTKFEIYPSSESKFFLTVVDAQIDFIKNDAGKITHLILHQGGQNMKAVKIE